MDRPKTTIPFTNSETFIFRQRSGEVNWREIQNLDIDSLIQSGNISKINELLETLTYSNIEKSDLDRFPDVHVLKLIRLSQFALEYLQQQRIQLESENDEIKREKTLQVHLNSDLENKINSFNKRNSVLSSQIKNKKKVLNLFEQYILRQPSMMEVIKRVDRDHHIKCSTCGKIFENFHYYESHKKRRHEQPSRPHTAQLFDIDSLKSSLDQQLKSIQSQQEKELNELRAVILQQVQSKSQKELQITKPEPAISKPLLEIDQLKKELLEIRSKKKHQSELVKERQAEIFRLEIENRKLLKNQEKFKLEIQRNKFLDSQKMRQSAREENISVDDHSNNRRRKITSESGMTNYVNHIYNDLVDKQGPFDQKDEEGFKRGIFVSYSERMSPSFKVDEENEYLVPIEAPEPQSILKAAQFLGIDPAKETQFLYLAREFLKNPVPKGWEVVKINDKSEFVNKETKQVHSGHPGIEFFKDLYRQIKNKKAITLDKLKAITKNSFKGILLGKYADGLPSLFMPDENIFYTQRLMLNEKVQAAVDKMKIISSHQLNKIHEEREKMFSERGGEYRNANEIINSELIRNFNKLKK